MASKDESGMHRFQRLPGSGDFLGADPTSTSIPKPHTPGSSPAESMRGEPRAVSGSHTLEIDAEPGERAEFRHPITLWKRRIMIGLFTLMASLLFADQNLLAPNLSEAAEYFGFDDEEKDRYLGGYIAAAFFAVGAPSALLMGILSDKYNRRNLLFAAVIIGETPCLCTYWVTTYPQFFVTRAMTGFAVGGCLPLLFSILGDLFPPQNRSTVSGFVQIATGAGVFIGQLMASWVGPRTNWKVPFLIASAPAIVVAIVIVLTIPEPPRGVCEEALQEEFASGAGPYSERITWRKSIAILKIKSNWFIFLQGLPGSLPWGMVMVYFNDYLSQDKGFSIQFATLIIALFGAGGGIGVIGGAFLGQWLYNKKKEWMAILAGITVILAIPPMMYLVNVDLQRESTLLTCTMAILSGLLASVAGPNLRAAMLNVNEPETRGVASALQTVTDDLGKALGPFFVAAFISELGRQGAFNIAVAAWFPCGILLCCLVFTMRKDEAAMQHRLEKSIELRRAAAAAAAADSESLEQRFLPPSHPHSDSVTGDHIATHTLEEHEASVKDKGGAADANLLTKNDSHLDVEPMTDGRLEPDPASSPEYHTLAVMSEAGLGRGASSRKIREEDLPGHANVNESEGPGPARISGGSGHANASGGSGPPHASAGSGHINGDNFGLMIGNVPDGVVSSAEQEPPSNRSMLHATPRHDPLDSPK